MQQKNIGLVKLSIQDFSNSVKVGDVSSYSSEKNIACYIKMNEKVFDIISFDKKSPPFSNLIIKKYETIEISFKNVKNNMDYGKIVINFSDYGCQEKKESFSKWYYF